MVQEKAVETVGTISNDTCTTLDFVNNWLLYTSDPFVIQCISGCKINFVSNPIQLAEPRLLRLPVEEQNALRQIINQFSQQGIIEKCDREANDFMNTVFLRAKRTANDKDPTKQ